MVLIRSSLPLQSDDPPPPLTPIIGGSRSEHAPLTPIIGGPRSEHAPLTPIVGGPRSERAVSEESTCSSTAAEQTETCRLNENVAHI